MKNYFSDECMRNPNVNELVREFLGVFFSPHISFSLGAWDGQSICKREPNMF